MKYSLMSEGILWKILRCVGVYRGIFHDFWEYIQQYSGIFWSITWYIFKDAIKDREREEEGRETLLYRYKGTVPIPSLGLMDDSAIITEVGYKSEIVNISMNDRSAERNL